MHTYKKILIISGLLVVAIIGFYLRILPLYNTQGKVHFQYDHAFHMRMVLEVSERGNIPETDKLAVYPNGRNISKELPTLLYYLGAYFNKFFSAFKKGITPLNSMVFFCALAGTLIGIPTYFLSLTLLQNRRYALIASFLSVIILPHLVRTFCYVIRYDGLGTLLLFTSISFLIAALNEKNMYKNIIYSLLSGFMLILALAAWRISLVMFLLYIMSAILLLIVRINTVNVIRTYITICAMGMCSFLFIPYLSGQHNYGNVLNMALEKITSIFVGNSSGSGFSKLLSEVEELQSLPLRALFAKERFSLAGLFPLFFIGYLIKNGGFSRSNKNKITINTLFSFFSIMMFALTLLFRRFQILFAPLVAVSTAGVLQYSVHNFYVNKTSKKFLYLFILVISIVTCVQLSYTAYLYASHLGSVFDKPTMESLKWINTNTPVKSAILSYWSDGYVVQLYTGRPTINDGLLEDEENQKRIVEIGKTLYSTDEGEFYALCEKYNAEYILLPTNQTRGYALAAGMEYSRYFLAPNRPTEEGSNTVLFKLLNRPEKINNFTLKSRNEKYLIYEVK